MTATVLWLAFCAASFIYALHAALKKNGQPNLAAAVFALVGVNVAMIIILERAP